MVKIRRTARKSVLPPVTYSLQVPTTTNKSASSSSSTSSHKTPKSHSVKLESPRPLSPLQSPTPYTPATPPTHHSPVQYFPTPHTNASTSHEPQIVTQVQIPTKEWIDEVNFMLNGMEANRMWHVLHETNTLTLSKKFDWLEKENIELKRRVQELEDQVKMTKELKEEEYSSASPKHKVRRQGSDCIVIEVRTNRNTKRRTGDRKGKGKMEPSGGEGEGSEHSSSDD